MLLNAAKCQGYSFYRFWVIKGKPTGDKITPLPLTTTTTTQIRVKEDWITGLTNYCLSNAINHAEGVSYKEAMKHNCKSVGKTHVEKRNRNQQSIESGLARMNEKDVMLIRKRLRLCIL